MTHQPKTYKRVLTIAGSDSSGGAGIQADIKAISACGCYAMSAITAITAQNTQGVRSIEVMPINIIEQQIIAIMEDIEVDAVKLGMLPSAEVIRCIATLLRRYGVKQVVLDPVMVATSGDRLISEEAVAALREELLPLAILITPNIPETATLSGVPIASESDFSKAAQILHKNMGNYLLIKAGHLEEEVLSDHLYGINPTTQQSTLIHTYSYPRIHTPNTHGTGCTLSSAIAAYLAQGYALPDAIDQAEQYLHKALLRGAAYTLGKGHGPVHHFYRFWE